MTCPHCARETVLKVHRLYSGLTIVDVFLVCAFCHKKVAVDDQCSHAPAACEAKSSASLAHLANLLGESPDNVASSRNLLGQLENRFCKCCRHFLRHPFRCRCLKHGREVDPMGDCPDFREGQGGGTDPC